MNERELQVVEAVRLETFPVMREGVYVRKGRHVGHTAIIDWHCCVLASRIAIDVLREHHIGARAMKAQVIAYNERAWQAEQAGIPWPQVPGASASACGLREDGKQDAAAPGLLNGHVIVVVERELLLDPSAVQFTRIEDGLLVEPLTFSLTNDHGRQWLADPGATWIGGPVDPGGAIFYRQSPDLSGLYDAEDWVGGAAEQEALREGVSHAVRARLRLGII